MRRDWGNPMTDFNDSPPAAEVLAALEHIARRHLCVATLQERHTDRLDFHDVGVVSLRYALYEAYLLGSQSVPPGGIVPPAG